MPNYELVKDARFADKGEEDSAFVSKAVQSLYGCWLENCGDDGLIDTASFDIEKYPDILKDFIIVDVVNACEDLHIRFLGSEMADRYPDVTGKPVSAVVPPGLWLERTLKIYHAVYTTGRAIINGPRQSTFPGLEHLIVEGLYVPMTLDGSRVDRVLAVTAFWADKSEA